MWRWVDGRCHPSASGGDRCARRRRRSSADSPSIRWLVRLRRSRSGSDGESARLRRDSDPSSGSTRRCRSGPGSREAAVHADAATRIDHAGPRVRIPRLRYPRRLVRGAPHHAVVRRRRDRPCQRSPAVPTTPRGHPSRALADRRCRRGPGQTLVRSACAYRSRTNAATQPSHSSAGDPWWCHAQVNSVAAGTDHPRCPKHHMVPPAGFEPAHPPPEGGALSPELRGPGGQL